MTDMKKTFTKDNEAETYAWSMRNQGFDVVIKYLPKGKIAVIISKPNK